MRRKPLDRSFRFLHLWRRRRQERPRYPPVPLGQAPLIDRSSWTVASIAGRAMPARELKEQALGPAVIVGRGRVATSPVPVDREDEAAAAGPASGRCWASVQSPGSIPPLDRGDLRRQPERRPIPSGCQHLWMLARFGCRGEKTPRFRAQSNRRPDMDRRQHSPRWPRLGGGRQGRRAASLIE